MKLTEHKTKCLHYFRDEQGLYQGEFKLWWSNGQQCVISHFRDGKLYGESKRWRSCGKLIEHIFFIDNVEVIDFLENPELYPETDEEKTMFVLKYGSAPFIGEGE